MRTRGRRGKNAYARDESEKGRGAGGGIKLSVARIFDARWYGVASLACNATALAVSEGDESVARLAKTTATCATSTFITLLMYFEPRACTPLASNVNNLYFLWDDGQIEAPSYILATRRLALKVAVHYLNFDCRERGSTRMRKRESCVARVGDKSIGRFRKEVAPKSVLPGKRGKVSSVTHLNGVNAALKTFHCRLILLGRHRG